MRHYAYEVKRVRKLILEGYIDVPESDLESVKLELVTHIALTQAEEGCLVFRIEQDKENNHRFNVYEEFVSEKAFEKHQERVKTSRWGSITKNVQRNYNITLV